MDSRISANRAESGTTGNDSFISGVGPENPNYSLPIDQPESLDQPFNYASEAPIPPSLAIHAIYPGRINAGSPDWGIDWDRG